MTATLAGAAILIVEDEYLLADELREQLVTRGAHVLGPVGDVAGAQAIIANGRPVDAVLLDINLRGQAAFQFADILIDARIPFAFATGYSKADIPRRFAAVAHCPKPLDVSAVLATVEQLIGH